MKKRFSITYSEQADSKITARRFAYTVAAGFVETAFSLSDGAISPEELSAAKEAGLSVEALHLPYDGVNLLWEPNAVYPASEDALPSDTPVLDERMWETLLGLYNSYFSFAAGVGVARVILTPAIGTELPPVSQTALSRFRALAECAKEKGVRLLVENDKSAPHFEAAVRVCCEDGFHGVSFSPARAWRYRRTFCDFPWTMLRGMNSDICPLTATPIFARLPNPWRRFVSAARLPSCPTACCRLIVIWIISPLLPVRMTVFRRCFA